MTSAKKLGIWLDHASAHIMAFTAEPIKTKTIASTFTHEEKVHSLNKSETLMHNKEQHEQASYYKKLGEVIRDYDEVILFGPTNAKEELYNALKDNPLFKEIGIFTLPGDKMTEHQEHAFVRDYFSNIKSQHKINGNEQG